MIWFIGYSAVGLVVWVFTARYLDSLDRERPWVERMGRDLTFATAGFAAAVWPLSSVALIMWHVTFRPQRQSRDPDEREDD